MIFDAGTDTAGVLAALGVAVCWAASAVAFSAASRRIGQFHVNLIRLVLGSLLLATAAGVSGSMHSVPRGQLLLLALSGLVGLALGDAALFLAFQILGARRASLIMALAPGIAAFLAPPLLSEPLHGVGLVGMTLTLAGVAWVVLERAAPGEIQGSALLGGCMASLGAVGQAGGLILSKAGMGVAPSSALLCRWAGLTAENVHTVSPLYGTLIRTVSALLVLATYGAVLGHVRGTLRCLADTQALRITAIGAVFGPFLGITLSLAAVAWTSTYVAATIMATQPIVVIPLVRFIHGERITPRAALGAVIAVAGVALLSLRERVTDWF